MKLLIITQKIDLDDDTLGFMHRWVKEFSKQAESVEVICLYEGKHNLPQNVRVHSLGKELYASTKHEARNSKKNKTSETISNFEFRISNLIRGVYHKILYVSRFYWFIFRELRNYDYVWVHMNQIYVILGALLWKISGKKIFLWYAHGHTPFTLRIAALFSKIIFTSTKSGCRLRSGKIAVVGQGIDTDYFRPDENLENGSARTRLIMTGRLSPIKDHETLIGAAAILKKEFPVTLTIAGAAGTPEQHKYEMRLGDLIKNLGLSDAVRMIGSVPYREIRNVLAGHDIFLNTSRTGSLDKAGLEAMAMGLPVVTSNEAYKEVLGDRREMLMFGKGSKEELAEKVRLLFALPPEEWLSLKKEMREYVLKSHGVEGFAEKIVSIMNKS